jgi:alkylation response protein AidB-like acyl-CoA dehydrogenase
MSVLRPAPGDARDALAAWRAGFPADPFTHDMHLAALADRYLDGTRRANLDALGKHFATTVVGEIAPTVEAYRRHEPWLEKHDGAGNRVERVHFTEDYHRAGRLLWDAGLVSLSAAAGSSFEQAVLGYLASLEGEMGHICAVTCTVGVVRVLRRSGDHAIRDAFLPLLVDPDYDSAWRGAQFLTEVQGGSDVGANVAVAAPAGDGTYRVTGEKWFCSVADADVFLVMARPEGAGEGTAGLGCFLVPRTIDGEPNGFSIRRLKEKLGTRSMASGEFDFVDAVAYPVGRVDRGFSVMVTGMLNTSRWLNAVGDIGIMRRAYLEASGYSRHRVAFGRRIGEFPMVRLRLAEMKAEWLAALHSTWALTELDEKVDLAAMGGLEVTSEEAGVYRFLVNANKLVCSVAATDTVRGAIEVLGGNGAIEDFSVLPRLLRDCVVYEQWEGTHNVLAAQVLRDLGRLGTSGIVLDKVSTMLKGVGAAAGGTVAATALTAMEALAGRVARSVDDPAHGLLHFRRQLEQLVRGFQVAHILEVAEHASHDGVAAELTAAASFLVSRHLDPGYEPEADPGLVSTLESLLGADLVA